MNVCLDPDNFGFICAGESDVGGSERNTRHSLSCLLQIYCYLSTNESPSVTWWQFSKTYGVTNYGSGWRNDVVNPVLGVVGGRMS